LSRKYPTMSVNIVWIQKRYLEWYIVILYWFIYLQKRSSWMRVVFDFNATASDSAPFESILFTVEWCVNVWIYKEIYWVIYCYIILIYLLTSKIKLSESCVWFQRFSKWFSSFRPKPKSCWMMYQWVCELKDISVINCFSFWYWFYWLTFKFKFREGCIVVFETFTNVNKIAVLLTHKRDLDILI
jgi:hypothetical protein